MEERTKHSSAQPYTRLLMGDVAREECAPVVLLSTPAFWESRRQPALGVVRVRRQWLLHAIHACRQARDLRSAVGSVAATPSIAASR